MRGIKFRGKRFDNNEWVYGYYVVDSETKKDLIYSIDGIHYVKGETVGQYLGSNGKNNVEIYEGDIVGADEDDSDVPMLVVFNDGTFALQYKEGDESFDSCISWEDCIVLGNKTDNPELLKEGI